MVWNILNVMQNHERTSGPSKIAEGVSENGGMLPRLPPGFDTGHRAVMMDYIVGLANTLSLRDNTLHIAACVVDKFLALQEEPLAQGQLQVVGAACLKVADVFAEQSKEYYKQENATEYAEASKQFTPAQVLMCEKEMLPKMDFDLYIPTTHWFVQCYLAYGRFRPTGKVAAISRFVSDLTLLDYELLAYPSSLRAQCALLLGVYLTQQAKDSKQCRPLTSTPSLASLASQDDGMTVTSHESIPAFLQSGGSSRLTLEFLAHWDEHVRDAVCRGNTAVDSAMCLQGVVKAFLEKRREWKSVKLNAVEKKHEPLARTLVYPDRFPVTKLVRYILPDCQRGLIPE